MAGMVMDGSSTPRFNDKHSGMKCGRELNAYQHARRQDEAQEVPDVVAHGLAKSCPGQDRLIKTGEGLGGGIHSFQVCTGNASRMGLKRLELDQVLAVHQEGGSSSTADAIEAHTLGRTLRHLPVTLDFRSSLCFIFIPGIRVSLAFLAVSLDTRCCASMFTHLWITFLIGSPTSIRICRLLVRRSYSIWRRDLCSATRILRNAEY